MSIQRAEYFKDLVSDAETVSLKPEVVAALVVSDSLNGVRKALLDISESIRVAHAAADAQRLIETNAQ
jgi:hypothetical protein